MEGRREKKSGLTTREIVMVFRSQSIFFLQRAIAAVDVAGMRGVAICDMNVDDGWWYNAVGSTVQRFQSVESEGREENNRFVKKGWKKKGPKQSSSVVNPKKRWGFCGDKS